MNRFILTSAALFITLGTVLLLLPFSNLHTSVSRSPETLPVLLHQPGWELSNDNIVDALHSLPLTMPIRRVEWNEPAMSIDLIVSAPDTKLSEMYENIADLLSFSFSSTINVNQVKLRLVAEDKWLGTKHLLLAADVRREDWDSGLNGELKRTGEAPLSDLIKQRFHVIETILWKNQFGLLQNG
ncbi:hypothetical protein J23TS9_07120 [Paenibacillus sp. J23TS9]|uniref:hypothetical protein n=1 Tax=Paenibacillus sp. J23TS9 TaxID=2807193 RepID=UPI001B05C9A5|nr:hypothetical protein [Paenibacillus sp. J23TS9]GIP25582.1 hypothetical protein J23TS9_07120 [Paenibacillus sp. J23TS9]